MLNHQAGSGWRTSFAGRGRNRRCTGSESRAAASPNGNWWFQQTKGKSFIGAARHSRECARSLPSIRGLTSNLFLQQFRESMIREIGWKQMSMSRTAIGPALITFSRPYFRGYEARWAIRKLAVTSYRGLFPVVEVPAGARGRLTLIYRPAWLVWGGSVAIACV